MIYMRREVVFSIVKLKFVHVHLISGYCVQKVFKRYPMDNQK